VRHKLTVGAQLVEEPGSRKFTLDLCSASSQLLQGPWERSPEAHIRFIANSTVPISSGTPTGDDVASAVSYGGQCSMVGDRRDSPNERGLH
jgi:hypothetical protein